MKTVIANGKAYLLESSAKNTSIADLNTAFLGFAKEGLEVKVVDKLPSLYCVIELVDKLKKVDFEAGLAALAILYEDKTVESKLGFIKTLIEQLNFKPELGPYKFATTVVNTELWAKRFNISPLMVSAKAGTYDNYRLPHNKVQLIAKAAIRFWSEGNNTGDKEVKLTRERVASIGPANVSIGCQEFRRELCESLFVQLGYLSERGDVLLT
jgi:hypothetical protein